MRKIFTSLKDRKMHMWMKMPMMDDTEKDVCIDDEFPELRELLNFVADHWLKADVKMEEGFLELLLKIRTKEAKEVLETSPKIDTSKLKSLLTPSIEECVELQGKVMVSFLDRQIERDLEFQERFNKFVSELKELNKEGAC